VFPERLEYREASGFGDQSWGDYGEHRYHRVQRRDVDWDMAGAVEDARWLIIAPISSHRADSSCLKAGAEFQRPS
jgi:hypothetical protein